MQPVEEEFDPSKYPPEYIPVAVDESLSSVLDRIEEAWVRSPNAVLLIPRGAQAFHTTHDFMALGKLQDSRQVRISVASYDPIITGLARLLGFYMVDPPPDHPAFKDDPATTQAELEALEKPTAPLPLGVLEPQSGWVLTQSTPTYPPGLTTSTWLNSSGDTPLYGDAARNLTTGSLVGPQAQRPGAPPPRTRPRQTGGLSPALITTSLPDIAVTAPPVSPTPSGRLKARIPPGAYAKGGRFRYNGSIKSARLGRFFAVLAAVLAVVLVAGSTYAYVYLPEGSVSVRPLDKIITGQAVEVSINFAPSGSSVQGGKAGVASLQPGSEEALTAPSLSAAVITSTLTEEGTRPATGTREVAKGKAQGTMRFTNRTGNSVQVPAGTQFKAPNGVTVQTTQGGTVAPTVFGSSFGQLELPIAATTDGPDGNIPAGQIAGIYGNNLLNYTNSALQGGGTETLKVVTQEDIDALVAELRAKAEAKAASVILGSVPAEKQAITQTIAITNARFEADRKAGEDGEAVLVKFTADAQAYVYDEGELRDAVTQAMLDSVQTSIPLTVGPNLDLGSVRFTPPVVQSVEQTRAVYRTTAEGRVSFSLTPELSTQIRALVRGKKVGQARNLIFQQYGQYLNPDSIEARVLWFTLDTLPSDPARISVEPSTSGGGYSPGIAPQDDGAPDPRSEP